LADLAKRIQFIPAIDDKGATAIEMSREQTLQGPAGISQGVEQEGHRNTDEIS
jgi:hypothetical protein